MSKVVDVHKKNPEFFGRKLSAETKAKISESLTGRKHSDETKARISAANTGSKHPLFGKKHSAETITKMSETKLGKKPSAESRVKMSKAQKKRFEDPRERQKVSEFFTGKKFLDERRDNMSDAAKKRCEDTEVRQRMSERMIGSRNSQWQGGISFEPYCPKFNRIKKEEIRNRDNRRCQLCGKSEILNGKRLAVHHIHSDKMQGCHGRPWALVALCHSCHSRADTLENEFLIVSNLNKDVLTIQGVKT